MITVVEFDVNHRFALMDRSDKQPKQPRSLATERRLISGAIALLRRGGLEACTIPAVAGEAGVAVGTIYRRFADKDALLRRVCESLVLNLDVSCVVGPDDEPEASLDILVRQIVTHLISDFRAEPKLYVAIYRFARDHADAQFRRAFAKGADAGREQLVRRIAAHPEMARRRDALRRARFAVLCCSATLNAIILVPAAFGDESAFADQALGEMLTSMLTRFLVER